MPINHILIKTLLQNHFPNSHIGDIAPINDGFAKHSLKILVDQKPYIFQVWKEPDRGLTSNGDFGLFSGTVENLHSVTKALTSIGISAPAIIFSDIYKDGGEYPCILMEFIKGATPFQNPELFADESFIKRLASDFGKLNSLTRSTPGMIAAQTNTINYAQSCLLCLETELETGSRYSETLKQFRDTINNIAQTLFDGMDKAEKQSLVHGDFKPNHFILSEDDRLYWLDLEGCKYLDVEFEISDFLMPFSFTNCRLFLDAYYAMNPVKPNQTRLAFYKLYRLIVSISACSESLAKSVFLGGVNKNTLSSIVNQCEIQIKEEYLSKN